MRKESWETKEFGKSHEGHVGVLLEDRSVPEPVTIDSNSGGWVHTSASWHLYDGQPFGGPRAHLLHAVCSCGWSGTEYPLDWERIGDAPPYKGEETLLNSERCRTDWYQHIGSREESTVAYPEDLAELLQKTDEALDRLASQSPTAALKAAVRLDILASNVGYHASRTAERTLEYGVRRGRNRARDQRRSSRTADRPLPATVSQRLPQGLWARLSAAPGGVQLPS